MSATAAPLHSSSSSEFAKLLDESLGESELRPGSLIQATVIQIDSDAVIVSAGLKSEAVIPAHEFFNEKGQIGVKEGDVVDVVVEAIEDGFGETRLSREKARRAEAWEVLERVHKSGETISGYVSERVKGGFTVEVMGVRAFLPGSLVDVRPVRDPASLENQMIDVKLIKMDRRRNNIVVSRRAVIEEESSAERSAVLENLEEGQEVKGVVKNITDYGAFVDLGGVDGLLHITDMSWQRVKHPNEVLKVGQELNVKILKYDKDKKRVSLGLKQMGDDPWLNLSRRYPVGSRVFGTVTNLTDYGCFVEIEKGIEGLVHMSEMDWTNKNIHPAKVVQLGDEVEVMVLDIDEERRRISLGIKQCKGNPWENFSATHKESEIIKGKIKSITDFGLFIGLEGDIDGLVHLSDISWNKPGEEAVRDYKKGQEVEAIILAIDPERERISLGIKQLNDDPLTQYADQNAKGSVVIGKVTDVDAKRAMIELAPGVKGQLRSTDMEGKVKDVTEELKVGDEVEAKITTIDHKFRTVNLTTKLGKAAKSFKTKGPEPANTKLGDLLKEHIDKK